MHIVFYVLQDNEVFAPPTRLPFNTFVFTVVGLDLIHTVSSVLLSCTVRSVIITEDPVEMSLYQSRHTGNTAGKVLAA